MIKLHGMDHLFKNLSSSRKQVEQKAVEGLMKAGVFVRSEGMRETPEDTGVLVGSWYGPVSKDHPTMGPVVEIGLTEDYAPPVHEMVGANFKKPGSKAKFLEDPLKRNTGKITEFIGDSVKSLLKER